MNRETNIKRGEFMKGRLTTIILGVSLALVSTVVRAQTSTPTTTPLANTNGIPFTIQFTNDLSPVSLKALLGVMSGSDNKPKTQVQSPVRLSTVDLNDHCKPVTPFSQRTDRLNGILDKGFGILNLVANWSLAYQDRRLENDEFRDYNDGRNATQIVLKQLDNQAQQNPLLYMYGYGYGSGAGAGNTFNPYAGQQLNNTFMQHTGY